MRTPIALFTHVDTCVQNIWFEQASKHTHIVLFSRVRQLCDNAATFPPLPCPLVPLCLVRTGDLLRGPVLCAARLPGGRIRAQARGRHPRAGPDRVEWCSHHRPLSHVLPAAAILRDRGQVGAALSALMLTTHSIRLQVPEFVCYSGEERAM
jgi:hypothetical protein